MDPRLKLRLAIGFVTACLAAGCGGVAGTDDGDRADEAAFPDGSCDAQQILAVANTASFDVLDDDVGLDKRAAKAIVAARPIATIPELDAVAFVNDKAMAKMLAHSKQEGGDAVCETATMLLVPLVDEEEHKPLSLFNDKITAAGEEPLPDAVEVASREDWEAMMAVVNALVESLDIPFASQFASSPNDIEGLCYRGAGDEIADLTDSLTDNVFGDMYFVIAWRFHDKEVVVLDDTDLDELREEVPEWDEFDTTSDDVFIIHSEGDDGIAVPSTIPPCK